MLAINLFVLPIAFGGRPPLSRRRGRRRHLRARAADGAEGRGARAPRVHRRSVGGDRDGDRRDVALSTMVCNDLVHALAPADGFDRARAPRESDAAPARHPSRRDRRVILCSDYALLPPRRRGVRTGGDRAHLLRGGRAVRAGDARRHLLEGRDPRGRARRPRAPASPSGLYTLLAAVVREVGLAARVVPAGRDRSGIALLKPYALFGLAGLNDITHAMLWSMIANVGALRASVDARDHADGRRAGAGGALRRRLPPTRTRRDDVHLWQGSASVPDLRALLARFLGAERADARARGLRGDGAASRRRASSGPTRSSSASPRRRSPERSARRRRESWWPPRSRRTRSRGTKCCSMLDEASQVIAYSHELERKSQALLAATAELRAANERLRELDRLKDDFVSTVSARAAHTAHVDPRVLGDPARQSRPRRSGAAEIPRHRDPARASA